MARKPDVEYIRFYTDGSAAHQIEILPRRKKSRLPKVRKEKKRVLYVDPLALGGIVVSVVMLVLMLVGTVQLFVAHEQEQRMAQYVEMLQQRNGELTQTYESGYDLQTVEKAALSMGMIPVEQAQTITIVLPQPEPVEEVTLWSRISAFFEDIFA